MVQTLVNIQKLDSLDDLECLVWGDVVLLVRDHGIRQHKTLAAYHGKSRTEQFQFLITVLPINDQIIMDRARKSAIQIKDGKIVVDEYRTATQSYIEEGDGSDYSELHKTLVMAGLR